MMPPHTRSSCIGSAYSDSMAALDPEFLRELQRLQTEAAAHLAAVSRALPSGPHLAALSRALPTADHLAAVTHATADQLAAMSRALPSAEQLASVARAGQGMVKILEHARRGRAAEKEILDQLAPRGWLISPSAPAEIAVDLLIESKRRGLDRVEKLLMEELRPDVCGEMLDSLYDRTSFAQWKGTFGKALKAHAAGDFELSVPIWLLAIDGICGAELAISGIYSELQGKKGTAKLLRQLSWRTITGSADPLLLAVIQVVSGFGKSIGRGRNPVVLNRHAVLHGLIPTIGTEKDSIQCILVLEVLHFCLEMSDRSKARQQRPA